MFLIVPSQGPLRGQVKAQLRKKGKLAVSTQQLKLEELQICLCTDDKENVLGGSSLRWVWSVTSDSHFTRKDVNCFFQVGRQLEAEQAYKYTIKVCDS